MSFQDQQAAETQPQPTLCSKGCGFFSNVGSAGMCSKCYREHTAEQQKAQAASEAVARNLQPAEAPAQPAAAPSAAAEVQLAAPSPSQPAAAATPESATKTSTRCQSCRKKVGLTGFKCKCGQLFCGQHRYAEAHDCTFDYKTVQREKLAAANPVVQASKVERI